MEPAYGHKHKDYFTRAEVAGLFEVSPNTVSRWVRGGKIPSVLTPVGLHQEGATVIRWKRLCAWCRSYSMGPGFPVG
jgi:transcriptional regulator with XRE-family HTH domain